MFTPLMFVVSSVSISPINPEGVAGESLTLTCTATITGRGGTPSLLGLVKYLVVHCKVRLFEEVQTHSQIC